jgi:hypothetical protein
MEKWIKYQGILFRLANHPTTKRLESWGGTYPQILYASFAVLLTFVARNGLGMENSSISSTLVSLGIAFVIYIVLNLFIYLFHLIQSPKNLFQEIGVKHFQDLNINKPEIELSEFSPEQSNFMCLSVKNKSKYPIKSLEVKVRSVKNIENHAYVFPKEQRSLRWYGDKEKVRIEPNNLYGNSIVSVLIAKGDNCEFVTYPPNPHRLPFGKYLIEIEFIIDYWWMKYKNLLRIEVDFHFLDKIIRKS